MKTETEREIIMQEVKKFYSTWRLSPLDPEFGITYASMVKFATDFTEHFIQTTQNTCSFGKHKSQI